MKGIKIITWLFYLLIELFLVIILFLSLNIANASPYGIYEMYQESFFSFLGTKILLGFILSLVSAFIMTIIWKIAKNKLELQEYSFIRVFIIQWILFFLWALISIAIYFQHIYSTSPSDRLP
ncbi:hypothetical protein SAMN05518672_10329 [Chitinophaga sp. CF118]|nr:hypothetical protein SAMN05518672_10329 [Chitinophaga sp. CF118]